MQNEDTIIIEPNKPWYFLGSAIFFLAMTVMLFTSKFLDLKMSILAIFMLSMSALFFWLTDRAFMNITFDSEHARFTGYFSIRDLKLKFSEIKGYELKETVNQFETLHKQVGLRTNQGKLIIFPKVAYSNYSELLELIKTNFELLEDKPLKNARFYNKWVPIIGTISGLLALLVAIMKMVK